jgi:hypothetical protein
VRNKMQTNNTDNRTAEELSAKEYRLNYRLNLLKDLNNARVSGDKEAVNFAENELCQADCICGYSRPIKSS